MVYSKPYSLAYNKHFTLDYNRLFPLANSKLSLVAYSRLFPLPKPDTIEVVFHLNPLSFPIREVTRHICTSV